MYLPDPSCGAAAALCCWPDDVRTGRTLGATLGATLGGNGRTTCAGAIN